MQYLLIVGAVFVVALVMWIAFGGPSKKGATQDDRWRQAASLLGLTYHKTRAGPVLSGVSAQDFLIKVDTFERQDAGERRAFTRIVIDSKGRIPEGLGDDEQVSGARGMKILQQTSHRRLVHLVRERGATISHGRVRWAHPGTRWKADAFAGAVRGVLRTAERLVLSEQDVPKQLLQGVRDRENNADIRREMLLVLLREHRDSGPAREISKELISHPDPALRLEAARAVGRMGITVLATLLMDSRVSEPIRRQAISDLIGRHTAGDVDPHIQAGLRCENLGIRQTVLEVLCRAAYAPALPHILELLQDEEAPPAHLEVALRYLVGAGDKNSEDTALNHLRSQSESVRIAAAQALGAVGSQPAYDALTAAGDRPGTGPSEYQACATALSAIRKNRQS